MALHFIESYLYETHVHIDAVYIHVFVIKSAGTHSFSLSSHSTMYIYIDEDKSKKKSSGYVLRQCGKKNTCHNTKIIVFGSSVAICSSYRTDTQNKFNIFISCDLKKKMKMKQNVCYHKCNSRPMVT